MQKFHKNQMNKIKIINEDILHVMQSTAKQFRVNQQVKRCSQDCKRPKTPQQIFNNVIKQAASTDIHFLRKNRLRTCNGVFGSKTQWSQTKFQKSSSPFIIEKKIDTRQKKFDRPMTTNSIRIRQQKQRRNQTTDIHELKKQINQVLTEIKQEGQLSELRKKFRYGQYRQKKFGKFWNSYKVKLDKKMYFAESQFPEMGNKTNINKVSKNFNIANKMHF